MVQRPTRERALALRAWFLKYMKGGDFKVALPPDYHPPRRKGFLVGPTQLCMRAGLDNALGSQLFGDGTSAKVHIPYIQTLRRLTCALREILEELHHPKAGEVTVIRAFIEAGYLTEEQVRAFLEAERLEGWISEEDAFKLGELDLRELNTDEWTLVQELYNYLLLRQKEN